MALVGSDHPECVWPCNTRNQAAPFAGNSFRAGTRPEAGVTGGSRAAHVPTQRSSPINNQALAALANPSPALINMTNRNPAMKDSSTDDRTSGGTVIPASLI